MPDDVTPDLIEQPAPAHPNRVRRLVIAGVAGAVIVGGGGAIALAAGSPSASAPAGYGYGGYGPGGGAAPTGAPTGVPKHDPHIGGTVTAVSGTTITVKDFDGFTRTIKTTSATTYSDGLKAPLATGTKIHATGTVDADGTSLDATKIGTMPTGGPGGPGGHGPGGRGPGAGTPPTGAPSGTPMAPTASPSAS